MEQRKITLRHEKITPDAAHTIVTQELYEHQRPIDPITVETYVLEMLNKAFRQGTVISFCVYKGRRFLVNGQHTLHALIKAGVTLDLGLEEIHVESLDERAYWYSKYDRLRLRSLKNIYEAHAIHEALNFNKSQTTCLGACLPLLAAGFSIVPRTHGSMRMYNGNAHIRMAFMQEWADEAGQFFATIKGAPGTLAMNIRRAPVMAVALVTYRFTGTDAAEFWHNVCQDDGLAQGDPRKALHVFLLTSKPSNFEPHVYSRYIAAAWNAAWRQRRLKNIQPQPEHSPISVEGTPHTAKEILRYITARGNVLHDPVVYSQDTWHLGRWGEKETLEKQGTP